MAMWVGYKYKFCGNLRGQAGVFYGDFFIGMPYALRVLSSRITGVWSLGRSFFRGVLSIVHDEACSLS